MAKGLFMGSSISPILVERVLEDIVNEALQNIDEVPLFWYCYVDDDITAIPEESIESVKAALEAYDVNITFTYETENERQELNYLDTTLIKRDDGSVISNWFHKPMASNRILNFYSAHPQHMKINTAKSFVRRVLTLSHSSFIEENKTRIKNILAKNNFPEKIIARILQDVFNSRNNGNQTHSRSYAFLSMNETTLNVTQQQEEKVYSSVA